MLGLTMRETVAGPQPYHHRTDTKGKGI